MALTMFAPVCPIHILQELSSYIPRAMQYTLPLAHDVLEHPDEYRLFYKNKTSYRVPNCETVILDNSVIELGNAVDIRAIAEAAELCAANVIVLPDVLMDKNATIDACTEALNTWPKHLNHMKQPYTFMIVPQGETPEEWLECAEYFADNPYIGWWGIGRNYKEKFNRSRLEAVQYAALLNPDRKMHLLGFSNDIKDDMLTANHWRVDGIDSAVPIRAASLNLKMRLTLDKVLPPRGNWWNDPETVYTHMMADNYKRVSHWINYRSLYEDLP